MKKIRPMAIALHPMTPMKASTELMVSIFIVVTFFFGLLRLLRKIQNQEWKARATRHVCAKCASTSDHLNSTLRPIL